MRKVERERGSGKCKYLNIIVFQCFKHLFINLQNDSVWKLESLSHMSEHFADVPKVPDETLTCQLKSTPVVLSKERSSHEVPLSFFNERRLHSHAVTHKKHDCQFEKSMIVSLRL